LGRRGIGITDWFSRIFFCNAINIGLSVIELREGIDGIEKDDTVRIDFENGIVIHGGNEYRFPALPKEVLAILEDGGLIPHVRKELGKS
jgi:3-isopropylmalate/(R)-2-methylmalate dehydratase small subunit